MPVIGHACVGLAVAAWRRPPGASNGRVFGAAAPGWAAAVVTLCYLPDILGAAADLAGLRWGRTAGHSLFVAAAATALAAPGLARLGGIPMRRALAIAGICIFSHVLLDLLQTTDRQLWWPFSRRAVGLNLQLIPSNSLAELLLFGVPCAVIVAWRVRRDATLDTARDSSGSSASPRPSNRFAALAGWMAAAAVIASASAVHGLRARREHDLAEAGERVAQRDFHGAIDAVRRASHWPGAAKLGRTDYMLAEAYANLGDRVRAEEHYRRSIEADPTYFWAVADLAVFIAAGPEDAEQRRQRVAPWVERLRTDFARHEARERFLARIERKLTQPPN